MTLRSLKNKRCVGYARYSTIHQRQESIEDQLRIAKSMCAHRAESGWRLTPTLNAAANPSWGVRDLRRSWLTPNAPSTTMSSPKIWTG